MTRLLTTLALAVLIIPALAEDESLFTPEKAADAVLAAIATDDEGAVNALAARDKPDPWIVADELCSRGEHDAAEVFARAAPGVDVESLPAYVARRLDRASDASEREALRAMDIAGAARRYDDMVRVTEDLPTELDTVVRLRLAHGRAMALRRLHRLDESVKLLERAARRAEELGWVFRAEALYYLTGECAYRHSEWPRAIEAWRRCQTLAERRADHEVAAAALGNIGAVQNALGEYREALATLERALALKEALGDRSGAAITLGNIGAVYTDLGEYGKALTILERALAVQEALGDRGRVAEALVNIGGVHDSRGDYTKALASYERALELLRALGNREGAALTLGNIGVTQRSLGRYSEALSTLERALEEKKALGDRAGAASTLKSIGYVHHERGEFAEALTCFRRALRQQGILGDREGAAQTIGAIANTQRLLGEYREAAASYEDALGRLTVLGARAGVARMLMGIGIVQKTLGQYEKALANYERALEEQEALGDRANVARTLECIGGVHYARGEYAKALAARERALELQELMGERAGAATTLGHIGTIEMALGNYGRALSTMERALERKEDLGDRLGAAQTLANIGRARSWLGEPQEALRMMERALQQQMEMGAQASAAGTLASIGSVQRTLGEHGKALAALESALALQEEVGVRAAVALTLSNIASLHSDAGDHAGAKAILERALEQFEALGARAHAAGTLANIGRLQVALGQRGEGRRALERSVRSARSLRARPKVVAGLTDLAWAHLEADEPYRALASAQRALEATEDLLGGLGEEEGARAREQFGKLYAVGVLAAARAEESGEVLSFLEHGRAGALLDALDKREVLRWKAETLPEDLRCADERARAAEHLARTEHARALRDGDRREVRVKARALDDATNEVRAVAARIQRDLKARAGIFYPRAETLETIQMALEADQALVLYGLCLDEALALVLTSNSERIVPLGARDAIEAACEAASPLLSAGGDRGPLASVPVLETLPDADAILARLRALLVEPLGLPEDVERVLVSPEDVLCYVPFGALFEQTVALTPSGTTHVLLLDEERGGGEGVLALGDPDYTGTNERSHSIYFRGRELLSLPATRPEAVAVGTRTLLGTDANEEALLRTIAGRKRWRALHFACHGLINVERPMLSSLALTASGEEDGFLTALEVLRMEIPADLAVLSACDTAKGKVVKGEGIVGLTRAFMYAGSPRVLCSLWKVDDDATRALMERFYELWNPKEGEGLAASEALREAQAFVRAQEKWAHPYYWAAWVLWGLP